MSSESQNRSAQAPDLVLFPTELEQRRFEQAGALPPQLANCHVVGFGPVASAARCAQLLAQFNPARVLLIGIAGSFDGSLLAVGTACLFNAVSMDGIGAGTGPDFRLPSELGFPQWPGLNGEAPVQEQLPLCLAAGQSGSQLLTVCSASGSGAEAELRRGRFPGILGEDMEGFAVAMACHLARKPLVILRGISNLVGERDAKRWDIDAALGAAHPLARAVLSDGDWACQR